MIKSSITQYFDNYEANKIQDIPTIQFRPNRNPFDYLPIQKIFYKDLRYHIKPKHIQQAKPKETLIDKFKRYSKEFEWRKSSQQRVIRHTIQYTVLHSLIVLGFYSRKFSGLKRALHVLKQTTKAGLYAGTFLTVNQAMYPFFYKYKIEKESKPLFSLGNLMAFAVVTPLVLAIQWNLFMALRKTLVICAFSQIRDFQIQLDRFYMLNPTHVASIGRRQDKRIRHPSQDPYKQLTQGGKKSKAQRQRDDKQKQELKKLVLPTGQKMPSQNRHLLMPQLYRLPTQQQRLQYNLKSSKLTQEYLDQKGIKWVKMQTPQEIIRLHEVRLQKEKKEKNQGWWETFFNLTNYS